MSLAGSLLGGSAEKEDGGDLLTSLAGGLLTNALGGGSGKKKKNDSGDLLTSLAGSLLGGMLDTSAEEERRRRKLSGFFFQSANQPESVTMSPSVLPCWHGPSPPCWAGTPGIIWTLPPD